MKLIFQVINTPIFFDREQYVTPLPTLLFMKKMKPILLVILSSAVLMLFSCKNDTNDDLTDTINKNGAVESDISVQHIDSLHDVLITKHQVWSNYNTSKFIEYRDTIPALGTENATAENTDGDTKNVSVKKDYEIFITVK